MHRLNLLKPLAQQMAKPRATLAPFKMLAMSAAQVRPTMFNTQQFMFSTVPKKRETLREREDRRKELSKLMEQWQCTIGFEFHVQMNTTHKMFSSKQLDLLNANPCPLFCSLFEHQL